MLTAACPYCGRTVAFPDGLGNWPVVCPYCEGWFTPQAPPPPRQAHPQAPPPIPPAHPPVPSSDATPDDYAEHSEKSRAGVWAIVIGGAAAATLLLVLVAVSTDGDGPNRPGAAGPEARPGAHGPTAAEALLGLVVLICLLCIPVAIVVAIRHGMGCSWPEAILYFCLSILTCFVGLVIVAYWRSFAGGFGEGW